jgi:hypothetical protein
MIMKPMRLMPTTSSSIAPPMRPYSPRASHRVTAHRHRHRHRRTNANDRSIDRAVMQ